MKEDLEQADPSTERDQRALGWIGEERLRERRFIPALEGLRGVALLGPLVNHIYGVPPFNDLVGSMGVTVFFVLSGFLITSILIANQDNRRSHSLNHLPRFWMDRVVRLQPALVACMVGNLIIVLCMFDMARVKTFLRADVRTMFSLMNTPALSTGQWIYDEGGFGHAWSLACEEQFYLVWCLLLALLAPLQKASQSRPIPGLVALLLLFCSLYICWRDGLQSMGSWLTEWRRGPLAQFWKMLAGSALRLVGFPAPFSRGVLGWLGLCSIASLCLLAWFIPHDDGHIFTLLFDIFATASTLTIIIGTYFEGNAFLESKPLRFLGRISYAAYLWTAMIIWTFQITFKVGPAILATLVGLVFASLSTFHLEGPISQFYRERRKGSILATIAETPGALEQQGYSLLAKEDSS